MNPEDPRAEEWDRCFALADYGRILDHRDALGPDADRRVRRVLVAALRAVWAHVPPAYRRAVDAAERYAETGDESALAVRAKEPPHGGRGFRYELAWRAYETLTYD